MTNYRQIILSENCTLFLISDKLAFSFLIMKYFIKYFILLFSLPPIVFAQIAGDIPDSADTASLDSAAVSIDSTKFIMGDELLPWIEKFVDSPLRNYTNSSAIPSELMKKSHAINADELLPYHSGIQIEPGDIPGGISYFQSHFFGSGSKFILDGIPISFPYDRYYYFNLQTIGPLSGLDIIPGSRYYHFYLQPIGGLSGIDVIPGSGSSIYGSGNSGVFSMKTVSHFPQGAVSRIELENGDYGSERYALKLSHNLFQRAAIDISGTSFNSNGAYDSGNIGIENLSAKVFVPLSESWNIEAFGQSHLSKMNYSYIKSYNPDPDSSASILGLKKNDLIIGAIHINGKIKDILIRTSSQIQKSDYQLSSELEYKRDKFAIYTFDIRGSKEFGKISSVIFIQANSYDLNSNICEDHDVLNYAGGLSGEYNSDEISALVSTRIDKDLAGNFAPGFDIGARYDCSDNHAVKLSGSYGFLSPSADKLWINTNPVSCFYTLIDSTGDTTGFEVPYSSSCHMGNEELEPEKIVNVSISDEVIFGNAGFQSSIYWKRMSNLIETTYGEVDSSYVTYINYDSSVSFVGANLKFYIAPIKWIETGVMLNYEKEQLDGYLYFLASGFLNLGYFLLDDRMKFNLTLEPRFFTSCCALCDNWYSLDMRARIKYLDFEFYTIGQNITDYKPDTYEANFAYGRWFRFGIAWDFFN